MYDNPEQAAKLDAIVSRYVRTNAIPEESRPEESSEENYPEAKVTVLNQEIDTNYEEHGNFPNGKPDMEEYYLWPGGPSQSKVEAWIRMFQDMGLDVLLIQFPTGEKFIGRSINRVEYKAIMAAPNTTPLIREEMITEVCTLHPENYDHEAQAQGKGGIPGALAKTYMRSSGFVEPMTKLL